MKRSDLPEKYLNGEERIPRELMRSIVETENKNSTKHSAGISLDELKKLVSKAHLNRILSNGYQIYEYLDDTEYINYEGFKNGELVAVKFNGVNYVTADILKYIRLRKPEKHDWKTHINAIPPCNFHQRYKQVNITL